MVGPVCRICKSRSVELVSTRHFPMLFCMACGQVSADLEEVESGMVEESYSHLDYGGFRGDSTFIASAVSEFEKLPRPTPSFCRLLDVGCGNGAALQVAVEKGWEGVGIDISPAAVHLCRSRGLTAHVRRLGDPANGDSWHMLTLWDVIEHIPEPLEFLSQANARLETGGLLLVKTPLVEARRAVHLMRHADRIGAIAFQLPGHVSLFSPMSLSIAFEASGFSVLRMERRGHLRGVRKGGAYRKRIARRLGRIAVKATKGGNILAVALKVEDR